MSNVSKIFDLQSNSAGQIKADALQQMDLLIRVEFKLAGNENFIALSLKESIKTKKPTSLILSTIRDMAQDNFNAVADMLGIELTDKILRHE